MKLRKSLILVIEPDEVMLAGLMLAISVNGYRVIGVQSLDQAETAMECHPIDAVHTRSAVAKRFTVPVITSTSVQDAVRKIKIALL